MRIIFLTLCLVAFLSTTNGQTPTKRSLVPTDVYLLKNVGDPQISPDGKWVAYTVSTVDTAKDSHNTDIWMVSLDAKAATVQLTSSGEGRRGQNAHQY